MPQNSRTFSWTRLGMAIVCLLALAIGAIGVAQAGEKSASEDAKPGLKRVESKLVCMVNNQYFGKDQIPVQVDGKTYYGCCEMCKERLAKDAAARTATDPLTGKPVDKATAVIAVQDDGKVLYFADEKNFEQYAKAN